MIEYKNIKDDPDSAKFVIANGRKIGEVYKGWLRLGGLQWVFQPETGNAIGEPTLKKLKERIAKENGST